jgi:hypothetical protein
LTKIKFNIQTIGDSIKIISLVIGAVIAFTAPFIHMCFDKSSEVEVFGYYNARMFCYAIGIPVTLFFSALFVSFSSMFIHIKIFRKIMFIISYMILSISIYYIIWSIWARKDFPKPYYYTSIIILSLISSYLLFFLIKRTTKNTVRLSNIARNLKSLEGDSKTINDIANIMPSKDETVTYKAMIDVTGENIGESIKKIDNEINKD